MTTFPCSHPGCNRPRTRFHAYCAGHQQQRVRYGITKRIEKRTEKRTEQRKPTTHLLTGTRRRPYVFAAMSELRRRARRKDLKLMTTLNELNGILSCRIGRHSLHDWTKLKPRAKCDAMLWNIYNRFPHDTDAALILTGTVIGTLLALELEPALAFGTTFRQFQIMRAIAGLMRPEKVIAPAFEYDVVCRDGVRGTRHVTVPARVTKQSRPFPTGRYVTGWLQKTIMESIQFYYQREAGRDFKKAVIKHMLLHPCSKQRAVQLTKRQRDNQQKKKERP